MPNAGAGVLEPNMEPFPWPGWGEAEVKLNTGVPLALGVPPKAGVDELAWLPKIEPPDGAAGVALGAPPNENEGVPPVDGVEAPPKLNMPPEAGAAEAGLSLPVLPPEKGLLIVEVEAPAPPKLKLNEPVPPLDVAPPKLIGPPAAALGVALEAAPNKLLDGWVWLPPKLKVGAAEPEPLGPVKAFFAGEGSSCFIGLPLKREFAAVPLGGDRGALNKGLAGCEASFGCEAPKLKMGAGVG